MQKDILTPERVNTSLKNKRKALLAHLGSCHGASKWALKLRDVMIWKV
jgi:hypothetical protein